MEVHQAVAESQLHNVHAAGMEMEPSMQARQEAPFTPTPTLQQHQQMGTGAQPLEIPMPPPKNVPDLLKPFEGSMHVPTDVYARDPVVNRPKLHVILLLEKDLGTLRGGRCV